MSDAPRTGVPSPLSSAEDQAARSGVRPGLRLARRGATAAPSPHADKFRLAAAVLGILAGGAIAIAVIALSGGRSSTPSWSTFQPQFKGTAGALQIANYISPGYRIGARQLAVITVSNLNGSTPVLKEGPTNADTDVLTGNTIVYQFCGLGPACSIAGKPSVTRLLLVRMEAFELALYCLHYLNVDNVVSILPPAVQQVPGPSKGGTTSLTTTPPSALVKSVVAVALDRQQLQPLLSEPVRALFPATPPALGGVLSSSAITTMDYVTAGDLFTPSTETGQDGTSYLVLSQLPAQ
jgi:hypothetical protein